MTNTALFLERPEWLKKKLIDSQRFRAIGDYIKEHEVSTVCIHGRCPNANECFGAGHITFLIMGSRCTRRCGFCAIGAEPVKAPDPGEPELIARTIKEVGLKYAVITSVTRDDLDDGGAGHYADVVRSIRRHTPGVPVEVLVPDFKGAPGAVEAVIASGVDVFGHNLETVERFYGKVRGGADYYRSLEVLRKALSTEGPFVKSGFMVGLGEDRDDVLKLIRDIRKTGCDLLTIGQYLRPEGSALPVKVFVEPSMFEEYRTEALSMGFKAVASGPFVRSSYIEMR